MACKAIKYDFTVFEGDNCTLQFVYADIDKTPLDITGASAEFNCAINYEDSTPTFATSAGTIVDAVNGAFEFDLTPVMTKGKVSGNPLELVHNIKLTLSNGDVHTVAYGKMNVMPELPNG